MNHAEILNSSLKGFLKIKDDILKKLLNDHGVDINDVVNIRDRVNVVRSFNSDQDNLIIDGEVVAVFFGMKSKFENDQLYIYENYKLYGKVEDAIIRSH